MKYIVAFLTILVLLSSCSKTPKTAGTTGTNKVLMLKVNYLSNKFDGGKELSFNQPDTTFYANVQFIATSDFGNIVVQYSELNALLFEGSISKVGRGQINFPKDILPPNQFQISLTKDIVYPKYGFDQIYPLDNHIEDFTKVWMAVQNLVKVREYLASNPASSVKIFLYSPSEVAGNLADCDWILFLKN